MKKLLLFSLFALLASAMGWAATETWTKVTSTPDSWDGDYLIVYEEGSVAFDGSLTTLDAANNTKSVTISDGTITITDCNFYFTIASNGSNYTIQSKSEYYIGGNDTEKNKLLSSKTDKYGNTISFEADKSIKIQSGKNVLRLNPNSNKPWFRYFKKSTYTSQQPIALYKKQEGPATKVAPLEYSPAFGDIAKGTEVTISCATEGAVLSGTIGETVVTNAALPYTFTASVIGDLKVAVKASKEGLEDSEPLSGTYNVCQPKVAALEINPGFGTIEVGTEITISCATEGAVLNGMIGDTDVTNAPLPYTFTAEKEGEISVLLSATKDGYDESEVLDNKFIVKAAVPVAYRDVINPADFVAKKRDYSYNFNINKSAVYNVHTYAQDDYFQFNKENSKKNGIVMTSSPASPLKIIINWHANKNSVTIYGKNIPYNNIDDLYGNDKGTEIATVKAGEVGTSTTIDLNNQYTYIGILAPKSVEINFIEFIWGEGAAGGADVTYTKASEAKAGNFAVLATADGKAVGRNADLNPVAVTVSGDAIGLNKSQPDVDEFEIIEKDATNKIYNLKGGLESDNSRCYLTYDATGVTTVATADDNADVTFESTPAGLLVKFNDGQYLMFNGTKFIKADYGEAVVQAEGETLTPVIVFMSSSNVSTGVETVEFDENAEAQYFNLNGVQVKAENLTPGLYIVRQGNKVSKQVIR